MSLLSRSLAPLFATLAALGPPTASTSSGAQAPVARTVALSATADTYLAQGSPNQNRGWETRLRVRATGANRALVRFDHGDLAEALAGNTLLAAHLELYVQANGGNWGDGRTVDVHRLTSSWGESATTWNCPADSHLGNHQPDCADEWEGGSFEPAATASAVHTDELAGWVRFEVTADLEAALAGVPFHGWLLKKRDEAAPGLVDYSSREVCGEEPRLVLTIAAPGPDSEPPRLAITSPAERFVVNQPAPVLAVAFFDAGSPVDLSSLALTLDGADLTSTCSVCQARATCPSPVLAEGGHTLAARLADARGNVATASLAFDVLLGDGDHRLTLAAVADAYLRDGAPNQNEGGDTLLRIRSSGKNRALVRFDLAGVGELVEDLHAATLELYLEGNGDNWGTSGRTVDAHALGVEWTEAGGTWNCPDDSNPANAQPDCPAQWNGGAFDADPTDSLLVTDGLEGWVQFEVTADVFAALAGGPHHGWLIRKTFENQAGLAEFSSKEGMAGQAPRLVLVFEGGEAPDTEPPTLTITAPAEGSLLDDPQPELSFAFADDASGVDTATLAVAIGGSPLAVSCAFTESTATCVPADPLADGPHLLTATIADRAGNVSAPATVHFTIDTSPEPPGPDLPPDPATVAPPLDRTVTTDLFTATEFLYAGEDPIQSGVAAGTIEPRRVAVIRGRVFNRAGDPLPGVEITLHGHPEFGGTLSRADGLFDLAVNGGGTLFVDYHKAGYLPVQRPVEVPWRDFAWAEEVVLVGLDPEVTVLASGAAEVQVARGSVEEDEDGARRATLLLPAGTEAELVLPDGTRQPLPTLALRATEYTVGPGGPQAMPGALPPSVGYTYAVELSADEALAAGAVRVEFTRPALLYVENFLDFPVGGPVPMGYYDRQASAWVGSEDGRVIGLLGVDGQGRAEIDVAGEGVAASAAELEELGVTDGERLRLGEIYGPGQSLWRTPIPHLTPWDCNWPYGPPDDAEHPPADDLGDDEGREEDDSPCTEGSVIECENQTLGESLEVVGTAFRLDYRSDRVRGRKSAYTAKIVVTGPTVPASLKRVELEIEIAGKLERRTFPAQPNQSFTLTWDGRDAYGRPLQGSVPFRVRKAYVYDLVYRGPGDFERSWARFPASATTVIGRGRELGKLTLVRESSFRVGTAGRFELGAWDAQALGIGGWSLSHHHVYDPAGRRLYQGFGGRRSAAGLPPLVYRSVGTGEFGYGGDGGPAELALLSELTDVAFGPDGSLFIADRHNHRIRRVDPSGVITTVAGTGEPCTLEELPEEPACGDGVPALGAQLREPAGVAVGPDGSLRIADAGDNCVRRVDGDGVIRVVAGRCDGGIGPGPASVVSGAGLAGERPSDVGPAGLAPRFAEIGCDDCPATAALLRSPRDVVAAPDGGLYIADTENDRVRYVSPDGRIRTFAGGGDPQDGLGDGRQATEAHLRLPHGLALGRDGSLYVAQPTEDRVRRIGADGRIATVAGNGVSTYCGDGGPAVEACLSHPMAVALGADGSLLIADTNNRLVREVSPGGRMGTLAGRPPDAPPSLGGIGGAARAAELDFVDVVAFSPDGVVFLRQGATVLRLSPALTGFVEGEVVVPDRTGSEVYVFDARGRHLRTLDALTAATRYTFAYDGEGLLSEVRDLDGKTTRIERDAAGRAAALVGPFGQRTLLRYDSEDHLEEVENPAREVFAFTYAGEGLLATMTDPRGHERRYEHQGFGRLIRAEDPAGGFKTLDRSGAGDGLYFVEVETALGRTTRYQVNRPGSGAVVRVERSPSGALTARRDEPDGRRGVVLPDGSRAEVRQAPDPRWGLLAPVAGGRTVETPGGLAALVTTTRTAILSDPGDPLSLAALHDEIAVNGRTYTRHYDAASRRLTVTTPEGRQRHLTLDARGRPVAAEIPGVAPVEFGYDALGRLAELAQGTGPGRRTLTLAYHPEGWLSRLTDPLVRSVTFAYDAAGRVTSQTLPDGRTIAFGHDANGNLASLVPPGRPPHGFAYTPVDLPSAYQPPALAGGPSATTYAYDLDRELRTVLRPDGQAIALDYDAAGRLASIETPQGAITLSRVSGTDKVASLTTSAGSTIAYAYDGFLPTGTTWTGPVAGSVARTYDADFRIAGRSVNGGAPTTFAYDDDGLLVRAGSLVLGRDAATGLVTGTSLGQLATQQSYNAFGELASWMVSVAGAPVMSVQLERDALGRIAAKTETIAGETTAFAYSYDRAGRLTDALRDGALAGHYEYDANGNRLAYQGTFGPAQATYDDQDRLLTYGDLTFTYTAAGELLTRTQGGQTVAYHYDPLGNLRSVQLPDGVAIDYVIDGANRRIGKRVNGTLVQGFLYQDLLSPIAELDGAGNVVSLFVYGSRPNVPEYLVKAGTTYRIVADHLGSPRLVIDVGTGTVAQRLDYDEFGRVILDTNAGFQPFGFAGGLYDPQTGLVRFGARDYDPEVGRWTAKDPSLFESGSANLYGYSLEDPVNFRDPDGAAAVAAGLAVGGLVAFTGVVLSYQAWLATPQGQEWLDEVSRRDIPPLVIPSIRPWNKPVAPGRGCPRPQERYEPEPNPPTKDGPPDHPKQPPPPELKPDPWWYELFRNIARVAGDLFDGG